MELLPGVVHDDGIIDVWRAILAMQEEKYRNILIIYK